MTAAVTDDAARLLPWFEKNFLSNGRLRMVHSPPLKVLLVDDDDLIQRAGKALLGAIGHQTTLAMHGREAIELLETETFDAVMLDLTMPVMSGKEAFFEIHRRWPDLPVAICTGYFVDVRQWLLSPGDTPPYVLHKPYSMEELTTFLAMAVKSIG